MFSFGSSHFGPSLGYGIFGPSGPTVCLCDVSGDYYGDSDQSTNYDPTYEPIVDNLDQEEPTEHVQDFESEGSYGEDDRNYYDPAGSQSEDFIADKIGDDDDEEFQSEGSYGEDDRNYYDSAGSQSEDFVADKSGDDDDEVSCDDNEGQVEEWTR